MGDTDTSLFEAVVERASDAILVADRDGRHIYANESAAALLGYPRDELLGLFMSDLLEPHPLASGRDRSLRRKDGSHIPVNVATHTLADGSVVAIIRDTSERVAMEQALRESEAKYRNLFENAQVGIFRAKADGSGVADVNARFCEIVATTRDEVLRRSPSSWWAEGKQRDEMGALLIEHGFIEDFEGAMVNAKGERIDVLASATVYPDGYYEGSVINVTERKRIERALRDSEARYRSVVDAMTDGIVIHGTDGFIVAVNAAAERILGVPAAELIGCSSPLSKCRAIREDGSSFVEGELPGSVTLRTGAELTGQLMGVHKPDGELTWVMVNSRRVTPIGELGAYAVVCSLHDITEKKRANEALLASLREKEVLLREIHHRVKNNLQIVTSLLYLQSAWHEDPRLTELLLESKNRVASMALVHQKLYESESLARIPFGIYVRDLALSLYQSFGVSQHRIALRVSTGSTVLSVGAAVPCGLILNEILSNALKHAFPNGRAGTIGIELELVDERYRLRAFDNGVGLPRDIELRQQSSLGMKLIERLADQLHGTVKVESSAAGTSYEVVFPPDEHQRS